MSYCPRPSPTHYFRLYSFALLFSYMFARISGTHTHWHFLLRMVRNQGLIDSHIRLSAQVSVNVIDHLLDSLIFNHTMPGIRELNSRSECRNGVYNNLHTYTHIAHTTL